MMPLKNRRVRYSILFLTVFYMVGFAGFMIPATRNLFTRLTPLALLLSAAILIGFHRPRFTARQLTLFGIVFVVSFLVEAIGVQTGRIFGIYRYGEGLGIQILETPMIIGLNWLMLVYCTRIIAEKIPAPVAVRLLAAPLLMVLYDLVLEHAAPVLDMWSWQGDVIPVRNYLAWYLLALIFHLLFRIFRIDYSNRMAPTVFAIQFLFFVALVSFFKLPGS
jgi:bisanhydrobacterioruberin hydratase